MKTLEEFRTKEDISLNIFLNDILQEMYKIIILSF